MIAITSKEVLDRRKMNAVGGKFLLCIQKRFLKTVRPKLCADDEWKQKKKNFSQKDQRRFAPHANSRVWPTVGTVYCS